MGHSFPIKYHSVHLSHYYTCHIKLSNHIQFMINYCSIIFSLCTIKSSISHPTSLNLILNFLRTLMLLSHFLPNVLLTSCHIFSFTYQTKGSWSSCTFLRKKGFSKLGHQYFWRTMFCRVCSTRFIKYPAITLLLFHLKESSLWKIC